MWLGSFGQVLSLVAACHEYAFPVPGNDNETGDSGVVSNEPIANAGPDQAYEPRTQVILDGSASRDPNDRAIVEYRWAISSMPAGSTVALSDPAASRPSAFLDLAGAYIFELTVRNEDDLWDSTPDRVQITALPQDGLFVQVTWDEAIDLDLHLLENGGPPFGVADCTWCNPNPSWGANGPLHDPLMLVHTVEGFGPEVARIEEPEDGTTYSFAVHYYGAQGAPECDGDCPNTVALLKVYAYGEEVGTFAHQLGERGEFWTAATVDWPGAVREVDTVATVNGTNCNL